jgi:hypothetical protein
MLLRWAAAEIVSIVPDGAGRRSTLTIGKVVTSHGYDMDSRITLVCPPKNPSNCRRVRHH